MNEQPIPNPEVSTDGQAAWSESGEEYFYDSLQEVLESVHGLSVGSVVYHGTKSHPDASAFVDVDAIIDTISDSAHGSDYSEWAEGYPEVSTEAREELEALVEAWTRKHCQPNFFLVKDGQAYTITAEDLARHAQQAERELTEEAQDDRDAFEAYADEAGGCSCHLNPPCGYCTHPGNPRNQEEDESCWKVHP